LLLEALGIVGALVGTFAGAGAVLVSRRHRAYRRQLSYNPKESTVLGMKGPAIDSISIRCDEDGFILPGTVAEAVSGFLELEVETSAVSRLFDPSIEIRAGDFCDIQYLERGAEGVRFLNVSRLLCCRMGEKRVYLNGRGLTWKKGWAHLHICEEQITPEDRILVVAPHPDDAEIAAFGVYAETQATVVTLTAGDASDRYRNSVQPWLSLQRNTVAEMRVWDSLVIPQFGGVQPEHAINLCLPDGRLEDMYLSPDRDFRGEGEGMFEFQALRRMNRTALLADNAPCSWWSLIRDLDCIIANVNPTIVIAPHPLLDPHPDHLFAVVAVAEALLSAGVTTGRMFLYAVHNRRSELWPFGPAGSGVALLPILCEDECVASAFYSHKLSTQRQRQKFLALEAMHDVRDIQWPPDPPTRQAGHGVWTKLSGLAHGMGTTPTSYLRRAVRPDEIFFVVSVAEGLALARCAAGTRASAAMGAEPRGRGIHVQ
jgi:hypothetical protein